MRWKKIIQIGLLSVFVVLLWATYLNKLPVVFVHPKAHPAFVLKNEVRVGITQGVSINNAEKDSQYFLFGVGRGRTSEIKISDTNVRPVFIVVGCQKREWGKLVFAVNRRDGEILDTVNKQGVTGVRDNFRRGVSEICRLEGVNPASSFNEETDPRTRRRYSGLSVEQRGVGGIASLNCCVFEVGGLLFDGLSLPMNFFHSSPQIVGLYSPNNDQKNVKNIQEPIGASVSVYVYRDYGDVEGVLSILGILCLSMYVCALSLWCILDKRYFWRGGLLIIVCLTLDFWGCTSALYHVFPWHLWRCLSGN